MNHKICSKCNGTDRVIKFQLFSREVCESRDIKIGTICQNCRVITLNNDFKDYEVKKP